MKGVDPDVGDMEPKTRRQDVEGPIHRSILGYLRFVLPLRAIVHHSPNEVALSGPDGKRLVAKATQNGMVKGFSDLLILLDERAYLIEVKPEGADLTGEQPQFRTKCDENKIPFAICRSIDDARDALKAWGLVTKESKMP
jgi:hypothetical protein